MELPAPLRQAAELALAGVSLTDLTRAGERLSQRYRAEVRDGRFHLDDELAAQAYLATRLPATYAAISACAKAVAEVRPDFAPRTLLDVGAGPGSALWAAAERWDSLGDALLIEASPAIRVWGERLTAQVPRTRVTWRTADITLGLTDVKPRDLVTAAYVLNELAPGARDRLVDRLWSLSADTLLLIEPGTPAGWTRILDARARLIAAGASLLAPCPHALSCPLSAPDWCHFSQRVARTRVHRQAKRAEVAWEDEKYIYLAASRAPGCTPGARVLATPRARSGLVTLKLCQGDGTAAERPVSKREGDAFRRARRVSWGDTY